MLLLLLFDAVTSIYTSALGRKSEDRLRGGRAPPRAPPANESVSRRSPAQTRRRFGGRQPLCGTGVMSWIEAIRKPHAFRARTDDSRPGPGPDIRTSRFLTPHSSAARPAASAATWAAKGVDLREPLNPAPPLLAHDNALPWRSVIVMIVLLNEAWICAMPSATFFLTFLRTRWPPACC